MTGNVKRCPAVWPNRYYVGGWTPLTVSAHSVEINRVGPRCRIDATVAQMPSECPTTPRFLLGAQPAPCYSRF